MPENNAIIGAVAFVFGIVLLVILEIAVEKKRLLCALPASLGTVIIFVGLYLTDYPTLRIIAVGAFAIGVIGIIISIFLLIFFLKKKK
ncbi:MAG: hypothetical protein NC223_03955 [Butyrivibrio sp.]|nr:hypothetical protein [Butyrivibrio sp.]